MLLSIPVWTQKKDTIVVAVSGGVDSMVLLDMLRNANCPIACVAHVQHGLREDDREDRMLVEAYCDKYNLFFATTSLVNPTKRRDEAWAREQRYNFLEQTRQKMNAKWIVTAHHKDDLVETVLLHISRGAGLTGLSGMQIVRGVILRPLLHVTKEALLDYAQTHAIPFREDSTNASVVYKRNAIRNLILPQWKKMTPDIADKLESLALQARDWKEYHRELVCTHPVWEELMRTYSCDRHKWNTMHSVWKEEFIREIYRTSKGNTRGLYMAEVAECVRWIQEGKSGTQRVLGDSLVAISTDRIFLVKEAPVDHQLLEDGKKVRWGSWIIQVTRLCEYPQHFLPGRYYVALHHTPQWSVRAWDKGDRFRPFGMVGQQKLSDFFINTKVPKHLRGSIPVILADECIVLVGNRLDECYRVDEQKTIYYEIVCYEYCD